MRASTAEKRSSFAGLVLLFAHERKWLIATIMLFTAGLGMVFPLLRRLGRATIAATPFGMLTLLTGSEVDMIVG